METLQVQQRSELEAYVGDVRSRVHAEMDHAYLTDFFRAPELEELPLVLATLIAREAGLPERQAETVISTLLLIHHGLATHEEIETYAARDNEKYRQLGVLAGAYYSSKYYRLLAMSGQIALIGRLAEAIQEILEAKAELLRDPYDMSMDTERYLELQETVHGGLLHSLREAYLPERSDIRELIERLVRAAVLHRELRDMTGVTRTRTLCNLLIWQQGTAEERRFLKGLSQSLSSESRLLSLHVKYGTSGEVVRLLERSLDLAEASCRVFPDLADDLYGLIGRLSDYQPSAWRAEEG
jgi:heptaprenyl diphosphate synthase